MLENMKIVRQKQIGFNIYELVMSGKFKSNRFNPGQFLNLAIPRRKDLVLRRPISICSVNESLNQITVIYKINGEGTEYLSEMKENTEISVLGPLGKGYNIDEITQKEKILVIGGGIGVAPLYELVKKLTEKNLKVKCIFGFSSQKDMFYIEKFRKYSDVHVATLDGSYGYKGNVVDIIEEYDLNGDWIFGCGPEILLQRIDEKYYEKKGEISLEERMACGIGACYGCVKKCGNKGGFRICTDGPVVPLGVLTSRN